jgi:hypothetical protein
MRRVRTDRKQQAGVSLGLSLLFLLSAFSTTAFAQHAQPVSAPTCAATSVTLANKNSYPIWIGEGIQTGAVLTPPGNNWEIGSGGSVSLCLPSTWTSGTFWARTECDFTDLYQSGTASGNSRPGAFTTCSASSDCAALGTSTGETYDCFGGVCMVDCSTSPNNTNAYCQGQVGIPGNTTATCSANTGAAGVKVCTYPEGVVCKSGDCQGQWECQGAWDSLSADTGPETPASQFEITNNAGADGGQGAATYDVTNVAGYNQPIDVSVDTPSNPDLGPACLPNSCTTDLNSVCPALLQIIEPPTGNSGSCGTNNGTCQTGICETCPSGANPASCNGGSTCVIGCSGPGQLCGNGYPSPISAPGVSNLECDTAIPSGSVHGTSFTADGSEYIDMYAAANISKAVTSSHVGVTMFSGNQGTPTCWGDIDCAPGETCLIGPTNSGITGLPSYVGICATKNGGGTPTGLPVTDCNSAATDIGKHCGGYPGSPVYTCVAASGVSTGVACLPAFDPPTTGLGTFDSSSGFFDGIGAPLNLEWEAAALWAAGNGTTAGTTPYYETFSNACPHQYAWTYDDHTGGLACNDYPLAFTVTFGMLGGSPSATPTPTPTASASATATATGSATPTASPTPGPTTSPTSTATGSPTATSTATVTATASPTSTATSTATPTATSTASSTPSRTPTATATGTTTATATSTATATITATSTPTPTTTPTPTPTPSGSPTPRCTPSFLYLTANPAGTLAFPATTVGHSRTQTLTISSSAPVSLSKLSTQITGADAKDFAVTGGSCKTIKKLKPNASCSYKVKLKAKKTFLDGVKANLEITAMFSPGVCPAGDIENVSVTLAGNVAQAGTH